MLLRFFIKWPVLGISLLDTLDMWQNEMQFRIHFFSGTGHSPSCPELTPLWLSADSAARFVFPWEQLTVACGAAVNTASSPRESSLGAAGQLIQLCPFPGAQQGSAAICWPCSGLGGQYLSPWFYTLGYTVAGTPGFTLLNKASRASKLRDGISPFCSHHTKS